MSSLVRHFLYLDTEEVLNVLSCLNDGDIEERTTKTIRNAGGALKLSIPLLLGTLGIEDKGLRQLEWRGRHGRQPEHGAEHEQ